jgi:hypothetical protein
LAECAGHTILRAYCGGVKLPEALPGFNGVVVLSRENLAAAIIENLMRFYRHYKDVKRVIRMHSLPSFQYHARRINNWKSQAGVPWL